MKRIKDIFLRLVVVIMAAWSGLVAQNPLILDQFTADPSARVFDGKVYVYPSHDILCQKGRGIIGFCMPDYHVFSSDDLINWQDHGVIVSQTNVPWVDSSAYSMWAPDCISRNGKYYFYFPAIAKEKSFGRGMRIGVAISDTPYGLFLPEPEPIEAVYGIDPNPFIDADGQAYLYWAAHRALYMAKLKENMIELATDPQEVTGLPDGFKEGPYLFERKGIYYFTFPYVIRKTEKIAYATGDNPMGPFEYKGIIMDESPTGCWTNHHSIIEYKDQWYLFYHHNDLSPEFDKNRSIRADSLFFYDDGTIRKVIPTWRGVGLTDATGKIQIDRYSAISAKGVRIDFLNERQKNQGWKVRLKGANSWVRYNGVNFGEYRLKTVTIKATSKTGGVIDIRIDKTDGQLIARLDIPKTQNWTELSATVTEPPAGIHNLIIDLNNNANVEIDWISFQ